MKRYGDSSTQIKIPYLGNTEETRKLTQTMDGLTQQADLLWIRRKISLTRKSMRKFGDSLTTTRTHCLGNTEGMKKLIQQTVMTIHQVDLLLTKAPRTK